MGWSYSIQAGYHYLCNRDFPTPPWMYWKIVWKSEAIPKVKFFMWTLLKGKILTSENLQKRGIVGPSQCPNCQKWEETIHHLFISCPFAISCWKSIAPNDTFTWNSQHSIGEVLSNWKKSYPSQPKKKNIAKRVWDALPYVLLWKIWIARNRKVFRDQGTLTRQLCSKAKSLAIETIAPKSIKKIDMASLCVEERDFIRNLIDKSSILPTANTYSNLINTLSHNWKIRLKQDEFNEWLYNNNSHTLFFDGASKKNPGASGVGGVIYTPSGDPLVTFEWGPGNLSNKRVEALTLYQGLHQLQIHGIRKALIFGDSSIIISLMNSKRIASNIFIQQIISRCQTMINQTWELKFFHILRTLNREADKLASQACIRTKGNILCNNEDLFQHLPWSSSCLWQSY